MILKEKIGTVISNKMNKTVTVAVTRQTFHSKYKKTIVRMKKYKAHDENNFYKVGDRVKIQETRPLSKTKHWQVIRLQK